MSEPTHNPPGNDRREFIKRATAGVISAVLGIVPLGTGVMVLLDPLRQKASAGGEVQVTVLDALPADGVPRKFPVVTDHIDAWNKSTNVPVGAVYLRRMSNGKIEALNVVCPHAGGFVDYAPGPACFICPLHNSKFSLDGKISDPNSPAPRGMDTLEVEIRNGKEVWVKFQNFLAGRAEKIPVI
jgi:menaquinol-cytochrome c reductase iron-sulfur subunit